MSGRWIRLDVGWDDSAWVATLEPAARLSWVELLCYTKSKGIAGRVKSLDPKLAGKKWDVPVRAVERMLEAARDDGALEEVGGDWLVINWHVYQPKDVKATERKRRQREKEAKANGSRRDRP